VRNALRSSSVEDDASVTFYERAFETPTKHHGSHGSRFFETRTVRARDLTALYNDRA
jgi:hypothetical protein